MIAISENTSLVFRLHLALFRLVGLSKRKIIGPSLTAFTGFPFALVFTWTFSECVTLRWPTTVTAKANHSREKQITRGKSISLTVKANSVTVKQIRSRQIQIRSRQKQFAHGKSKSLTAKANRSRQKQIRSRQNQINSECDIFIAEVIHHALFTAKGIGFTHRLFSIDPRFASYC